MGISRVIKGLGILQLRGFGFRGFRAHCGFKDWGIIYVNLPLPTMVLCGIRCWAGDWPKITLNPQP